MRARLVRPGLELTEVGLGGAPIGNLYGAVTDGDAAAAIEAAWDAGVRYFDTAPHYGLGLSERRLGAALAAHTRDEFVVSTKVGRRLVEENADPARKDDGGFDVPATARRAWDFTRDGVYRSLESSLERLGMDRVDLVLLHDPDDHWPEAVEQAMPALAEMRAQGLVAAIGVGMNQSAMLTRFVKETDVDVVMVAGRWTLLDQSADRDLLPAALDRDVAVVAAGAFNSGLLATRAPAAGAPFNYEPAPPAVVSRARHLARICDEFDVALPTVARNFPATHPAVASVVIGAKNAAEVRANTTEVDIPEALWRRLESEGLLPDAPSMRADV